MLRFVILIVLLFGQIGLFAQFSDDFNDGDLTNPAWQGDLANFKVNDQKNLQLAAPSAGASSIFVPVFYSDSTVWEMWVKMDFSPSKTNQLQVYLLAQNSDLLASDAIYLALGENGNNDAIHVFERKGGVETILASSVAGSIANGPILLKIVIEKLNTNWKLSIDDTGGNNPIFVADWALSSFEGNAFFGFNCNYTATRVDKFFFDDINIKKYEADTSPPSLATAEVNNAQEIEITFNEPILASDLMVDNFQISSGIGMPADIDINSFPVKLILSQDLSNGQTYTLTATNIKDVSGNIGASSIDFTYAIPETLEPFDIVINEIFPDPKPSLGLPESEFVELYNRSDKVLNLKEITLMVNNSEKELPDYKMLPGAYVTLVDESDIGLWANFENVLGVDLPGLSNAGATLSIQAQTTIHQVTYTSNSYQDNDKDDGGWSLELINPDNPCLGDGNWLASNNLQGGTPSQMNSVFDDTYKTQLLKVIQVFPSSAAEIVVIFDQVLGNDASDVSHYSFSPSLVISGATIQENQVVLSLGSNLQPGTIHELTVESNIKNCIGQAVTQSSTFKIGLAEAPTKGDLIINEILFNPITGGKDYVELFNTSNKIININDLTIANISDAIDVKPILASGLLFPNAYVAFTEAPYQVEAQYETPDTVWIIENKLPNFNDNAGNVSVIYQGLVIDSMNYDKDMHLTLIANQDGVALERINPHGNSTERSNWISGASTTNYGTPGYKNEQFTTNESRGEDYITIDRKVCSPDGDGFEDFLLFQYNLPESGYVLNARVFNASGQYVHRLANNELLGENGQFRWTGEDDLGNSVSAGIYVVRFEFFQSDGDKVVVLKSCGIVR